MRKGTKRLMVILGVVVGTPLLGYAGFAAYLIASPAIDSYRHQMHFDSEQWKGRSQDAGLLWPTRLRMVDDLRARHLLDGLPRHRVVALLGPPDETAKWRNWDLAYELGPERGLLRIDSEWLVIRIDPDGRTSNYELVRD